MEDMVEIPGSHALRFDVEVVSFKWISVFRTDVGHVFYAP